MYYAYKYRLEPSNSQREELDRHRNICRQLYNHTLYRLNEYQDEHGELPSMTTLRSELPDLKKWWDDLNEVYSKVLQTVVERLFKKPQWPFCAQAERLRCRDAQVETTA